MYATAIMGGHTIGGANISQSGFDANFTGNYTDKGNMKFSNKYYLQMLTNGWIPEQAINRDPDRNQWVIADSSWAYPEYKIGMLETDLCLAYDNKNEPGVFLNASSSTCCAWTEEDYLFRAGIFVNGRPNNYCGSEVGFPTQLYSESRTLCCVN